MCSLGICVLTFHIICCHHYLPCLRRWEVPLKCKCIFTRLCCHFLEASCLHIFSCKNIITEMYTVFFIKSGIVVSWHYTHCRTVWKYKYTFVLVNSFNYMEQSHFWKAKSLSPSFRNNSTSCRMGKVHYNHTFTLQDPILNHMNPTQTLIFFFFFS